MGTRGGWRGEDDPLAGRTVRADAFHAHGRRGAGERRRWQPDLAPCRRRTHLGRPRRRGRSPPSPGAFPRPQEGRGTTQHNLLPRLMAAPAATGGGLATTQIPSDRCCRRDGGGGARQCQVTNATAPPPPPQERKKEKSSGERLRGPTGSGTWSGGTRPGRDPSVRAPALPRPPPSCCRARRLSVPARSCWTAPRPVPEQPVAPCLGSSTRQRQTASGPRQGRRPPSAHPPLVTAERNEHPQKKRRRPPVWVAAAGRCTRGARGGGLGRQEPPGSGSGGRRRKGPQRLPHRGPSVTTTTSIHHLDENAPPPPPPHRGERSRARRGGGEGACGTGWHRWRGG